MKQKMFVWFYRRPSSNFDQGGLLSANNLRKGMVSFLLPISMSSNLGWWQPVKQKDNSEFKAVEKITGNHRYQELIAIRRY